MKHLILPGVLGLLLGLTLRWTRLCHPDALRRALALRVSHALRSLLFFLGAGMALTALLMWLAVIDVDSVVVLPLSAGALAGGALAGIALALCGYTPLTAFAGVGGGQRLSALCTLAGCLTGTLLLPLLDAPLAALRALPPHSATTLFAVTLDEPYLLGGGFLSQGCAGLLLAAIAACIPSNRQAAEAAAPPDVPDEPVPAEPAGALPLPEPPPLLLLPAPSQEAPPPEEAVPEEEPAPPEEAASTQAADPPEAPAQEEEAASTQDALPSDAEEAAEETFVALLPGEEPLVVDTSLSGPEPGSER